MDKSTIGANNYVEHSMDILDRIHELLIEKFDGKQSELAKKLGKKESEVSRWLNGVQNFTLFTISKLEEAFDDSIITITSKENKTYSNEITTTASSIDATPKSYNNMTVIRGSYAESVEKFEPAAKFAPLNKAG